MANNNVLVIGGTGGVGLAVCQLLTEQGYRVLASCRTKKQQRALEGSGVCHNAIRMNLGSERSIHGAFEELESMGVRRLVASVNCAAITKAAPLEEMNQKDLKALFQINVIGTLLAAQRSIPLLRPGKGRLVMVGSSGGDIVLPLLGAYSATKFSLEAICDALRRELANDGIRVSLIKPGAIKTNMTVRHVDELTEEIAQRSRERRKRYLTLYKTHRKRMQFGYESGVPPEQVADVVLQALRHKRPKSRYTVGLEPAVLKRLTAYASDTVQDELLKRIMVDS